MLVVLKIVFRITILFGGLLLIYTVTTMFPDEEGRLQNRIENLWIAVDDKQKTAVGRATLLFNRIASYVTRVYNRILGKRLISVQMIGVSSASSIAAFFFFGALLLYGFLYISISRHVPVKPDFNPALLLIGTLCMVLGIVPLVFAFIPSLIRNWFGRAISLLPLILFTFGSVLVILRGQGAFPANQLMVLAGLLVGVISDILVLGVVRFSVRLISTSTRVREIVFATGVQIAALVLIVVVPYELSTPLIAANKDSLGAKILLSSMMFNFFTVIGVAAFLILLAIVMLHRLFWPMLGRVIFSIARFRPLQNNRKSFAIMGMMCVLYGAGLLSSNVLVTWFARRFTP